MQSIIELLFNSEPNGPDLDWLILLICILIPLILWIVNS